MKNTKVMVRIIIAIAILSLAIVLYSMIGARFNTMEVAFYDLPEKHVEILSSWLDERNIDWKPVVLDSTIPLEEQMQGLVRQNLLFTHDGKNMDMIAPLARTAKSKNLALMPIPVRISVQTNSRLTATPVLIDHFQLSYDENALLSLGKNLPTNLVDLEDICKSVIAEKDASFSAPILCAGKNDDDLLMFFSSMLETLTGITNYSLAKTVLEQDIKNLDAFFSLPQVYDTLQYITRLEKEGYLSISWLNLSREDVIRAMDRNTVVFAFLPFNVYATECATMPEYGTWYMPSGTNRDSRYLLAKTLVVMEFSYVKSSLQSSRQASKKADLAHSLIAELVSGLEQSQLSASASLIPVNASAFIEDVATEENRDIISLSDGIIADIVSSCIVDKEEKTLFVSRLREEIVSMRAEDVL